MIETVTQHLTTLAERVPLQIYIFLGAIVEELVAPIPSPLVMSLAGSIANAQGRGIGYLLLLSLVGSTAKTLTTLVFYFLGDKAEDVIIPRFGKFLGVTHDDLEHFGEHFQGSWKDIITLSVIRAIPVMPSTPVSLVCGVLKITMKRYLLATFCGFYLRDLFFIILGYMGISAYSSLMEGIDSIESIILVVMVLLTASILAYLYWKRRQGHPAKWFRFGGRKERNQ
ncbi:MAG: VTT domain-containing protein [Candidatus Peregrinibacteria bacterium]|nr:VTT domain-containing protein [Candidatus Peregrinibacteria bacterium]